MVTKYVLRHIPRAPLRSLLSLLLAAALTASLGQFIAIVRSNRALVGEMYDTAEVYASPANRSGVVVTNIPFGAVDLLLAADFSSGFYGESTGQCYWVTPALEDGAASLYATTDPELFGRAAGLTYAEGYGADVFAASRDNVCFLSETALDRLGLKLGDEVNLSGADGSLRRIYANIYGNAFMEGARFTVIGSFRTGLGDYDVLMPWGTIKRLYDRFYPGSSDGDGTMQTAVQFRVRNDLLRDERAYRDSPNELLAKSSSQRISELTLRFFDDEVKNVIKPLEENTDLLELLLPFVGAAVVMIGAAIPGLVILQSSKEAATMRALGTTRRRVMAMLVCEQMLLTLAGLALGVFGLFAAHGFGHEAAADLAGAYGYFAACALLSAAVCIAASAFVSAGSALKLLQSGE